MGDIGKHFPDTDPEYKDIDSIILLKKVKDLLKDRGYRVINVDSVICAQRPKLAPYIDEMRRNIADTLGIAVEQISIKATTTEGLGFEGREEGISAHAVCLIEKFLD